MGLRRWAIGGLAAVLTACAAPPERVPMRLAAAPSLADAAAAYGRHVTMLGHGLRGPNGLAVDRAGNLYESDWSGNSITRVAPDGTCSRVASGFNGPAGLAFDRDGTLLVACYNAHTLERVTLDGKRSVVAKAGLKRPVWPAVDSRGRIYVADYANNRIAAIARDGTATTFVSLPGVNAIAVDPTDTLWVTTWGGRVARVTSAGAVTDVARGLSTACGIAWGSRWVAVVTYGNERKSTARLLLVDATGHTAEVATGLNRSSSVLFDVAGRLVTANIGDSALRRFALK